MEINKVQTDELKPLEFGCNLKAIPEGVKAKWGARLIGPADLLYDRQDLVSIDDTARSELISWLNGDPDGTGAIHKMQENLRDCYYGMPQNSSIMCLYSSHNGEIWGSTQGSFGYVYVVGFLYP